MDKNQTLNLRNKPRSTATRKPDSVDACPNKDSFGATADASLSTNWSGKVLGEYEVGQLIGVGGNGRVFKARHRSLNMPVALKILNTIDPNEEALNRFRREAMASARLIHPNLIRATDAGIVGETPFLVTDFVEGIDARQLVDRVGVLSVANACELSRAASEGLKFLAKSDVVHRDIKPSNIMVDTSGQVRILDLGLAATASDHALTMEGQIMGTLDFISPEQATNPRDVGFHADMYSMGCTLYFLLAGQAPFQGELYEAVPAKILAHVEAVPAPIDEFRDDIPRKVAKLVMSMLEKHAVDRPSSFEEVTEILDAYTQGHNLSELVSGDADQVRIETNSPTVRQSGSIRTAAANQQAKRWIFSATFLLSFLASIPFLGHSEFVRQLTTRVASQSNEWSASRTQPINYSEVSGPTDADAGIYNLAKNHDEQQRSIQNFKAGDYVGSAKDAYEALCIADAWDWQQLINHFASREDYLYYLRKLESSVEYDPTASSTFLLTYHRRMLGHKEEVQANLALAQHLLKRPLPKKVAERLVMPPTQSVAKAAAKPFRRAPAPPGLNAAGRSAWYKYVKADSHKAWVHNDKTGNYGYATRLESKAAAIRAAMNYAKPGSKLYSLDGELAKNRN